MSETLHELTAELRSCIDMETGELDVERWERVAIDFDAKVNATVHYIENRAALEAAVREKAAALAERAAAIGNGVARAKQYLLKNMEAAQKTKIETADFRVTVVRNSWPAIDVHDLSAVPQQYLRTVTRESLDKKLVATVWKASGGEAHIPGVYITTGKHLRIK